MALIAEFLPTKDIDIESSESASAATNFLTTTLRSILFSTSSSTAGRESEADKKLKHISLEEVSDHDSFDDCWIIIYDRIYDVTGFLHRVSILSKLLHNWLHTWSDRRTGLSASAR